MPSTKPKIVIRTDEETISKLDKIAEKENRSRSNMAEQIIKKYINEYEEKNGNVIKNLSISKII